MRQRTVPSAPLPDHVTPPGWSTGTPLRRLLEEGPLTTAQAVAVGLSVLEVLEGQHAAGRSHGRIGLDTVGIGPDGSARLPAADGSGKRAPADLRAAGALIGELLGSASPADEPAPTTAAERAAPAVVAVARSLAGSADGWTAASAAAALKDAAGFCGSEPVLARATAELGELAERTAAASAVAAAVDGAMQAVEPPSPAVFPPRTRLPVRRAGGLLAAVLICGAAWAVVAARHADSGVVTTAAAPPAPPSSLHAASPTAAVSTFFDLAGQGRLDKASLLWKPKIAGLVDLQTRFGGLRSVTLQRDSLVAEDDRLGIATVEAAWTETAADGTTRQYRGEIYLDDGPLGWRWDSWNVSQAPVPAAAPGSQSGSGDDGG